MKIKKEDGRPSESPSFHFLHYYYTAHTHQASGSGTMSL